MGRKKFYVLKIITDKDKLSDRFEEVNPDEPVKKVASIVNDVKRTLKANKDLVALSAPQLGYNKRIFCIKFKDKIMTFINPLITHSEGQHFSRETNASVSGEYILPRANNVVAIYQDEHGKIAENKFDGMASDIFQQMYQLLDGVLIDDLGLEVMEGFDDLSDDERSEILSMYVDYLKDTSIKMDKHIESDKTLHDMKQAIDYMSSVAKGETDVVPEYNGELDFSQSTKKRIEKENEIEKENKERLKKKIEELQNKY